jgi:hypothetical protein
MEKKSGYFSRLMEKMDKKLEAKAKKKKCCCSDNNGMCK